MNRKRLLECGASLALGLTLLVATGTCLHYRALDDALMAAARKADLPAVQRLLDRGANPNVRGTGPLSKMRADKSVTPLRIAAGVPSGAVVKELLRRGADPNAQDDDGDTALILAASTHHLDVTQILLRSGADPNIRDDGGWTALMYAVANGNTAIVEELLAASESVHDTNNRGETAVALARKWTRIYSRPGPPAPPSQRHEFARERLQDRKRYERIVELLRRAGAKN